MKRKIIEINEEKCDGCGVCVPECHEGALQVIDGKVRLISDLFCDGLGACLGYCPQGALKVVEREAEPYDERLVMEKMVRGGKNVIKAHLEHLLEHNEMGFFKEAVQYLKEQDIPVPVMKSDEHQHHHGGGCPGAQARTITPAAVAVESGQRVSHLEHWPIQLHLMSPMAPDLAGADLLLAADCCGFSYPDFHKDFLKGKRLAIACPKLDSSQEMYLEKLTTMIRDAGLKSLTVLVMQVPCCTGLAALAQKAISLAGREIPLEIVVIGINGTVLKRVSNEVVEV